MRKWSPKGGRLVTCTAQPVAGRRSESARQISTVRSVSRQISFHGQSKPLLGSGLLEHSRKLRPRLGCRR